MVNRAGILLGRGYRSTEGQGICRYLPRSNFNPRTEIFIWVRKEVGHEGINEQSEVEKSMDSKTW